MRLFVRAKPNSKKPGFVKLDETHFAVSVAEPPRDGKANRAIAKALAEHLGISPSRVHLASGATAKEKVFEVF